MPTIPSGGSIATMPREARKSTLFAVALERGMDEHKRANIIHEGYLLKSVPVFGGMGMKWRKRFCRVYAGLYPTLTVQSDPKQQTPDESIPLDDATFKVPCMKKNTGVSFVFQVKNKKYRAHEIKQGHQFAMLPSEGEQQMNEWMRQMELAGRQCENKARCQQLGETLTAAERDELKRETLKLMNLPCERIEEMSKELLAEEDLEEQRIHEKYGKLKEKMVDLLGERFGKEFESLGKVVPHNLHDPQSPLQKRWSVLVSQPKSI